jgi:hypothetical protein
MKAHKEIKYEDLNITDIAASLTSPSDSESINTYRSSDDVNIMEKYDLSNTFISISPAPCTKSSPTNDSFSDESSLSAKKTQTKNNNHPSSKNSIKFDKNPIDQNKLLALLSDVDKKKLHE